MLPAYIIRERKISLNVEILSFVMGMLYSSLTESEVALPDLPDEIIYLISLIDQDLFSTVYRTCHKFRTLLKTDITKVMIHFRQPISEQPLLFKYPNGFDYGIEITRNHDMIVWYEWKHKSQTIRTINIDLFGRFLAYTENNETWVWEVLPRLFDPNCVITLMSYKRKDGKVEYELCLVPPYGYAETTKWPGSRSGRGLNGIPPEQVILNNNTLQRVLTLLHENNLSI